MPCRRRAVAQTWRTPPQEGLLSKAAATQLLTSYACVCACVPPLQRKRSRRTLLLPPACVCMFECSHHIHTTTEGATSNCSTRRPPIPPRLPFLVLIGSRVSFRAKLDRLRPRSRSLAACTHEDRPHSDNALAVRLEWTTAILITDLASSRESEPTRSRLPVRAQGEITATPVTKQLARAPTDCKRETVDKVRGKT